MLYFQTDTNTFAYAYRVSADFAEEMEEEYRDAISSLELTEIEKPLSLKGKIMIQVPKERAWKCLSLILTAGTSMEI